jgi:hypothetical protein
MSDQNALHACTQFESVPFMSSYRPSTKPFQKSYYVMNSGIRPRKSKSDFFYPGGVVHPNDAHKLAVASISTSGIDIAIIIIIFENLKNILI